MVRHHRSSLRVEALESRITPDITAPNGFTVTPIVDGGLSNPTAMTFTNDGRILITEQEGDLRIVINNNLVAAPAISLNVQSDGERGLLGVTLDPNFASNGHIYLYYTTTAGGVHNRVSRFTLTGTFIDPASEVVLLELDPLSDATNHNGGAMRFGPDGKLYIATGENATPSNAQTVGNLHGKILRINRDGSIPSDNPFFNQLSGKNRAIWAFGLRNPYTFAFQPVTGRMFINDVGGSAFEEINEGRAGANYGWPVTEGPTNDSRFDAPFFSYQHPQTGQDTPDLGFGYAITGGTFYNPTTVDFPSEYVGDYFYADFASGWIRSLDVGSGESSGFILGAERPLGLEVNPANGALYFFEFASDNAAKLNRVEFNNPSGVPVIASHPRDTLASVGQAVTFRVSATGSGTLRYQWQRNGEDIPNANQSTYTLTNPQLSDDGATFRVIVSNDAGSTPSNAATLSVTTNSPPEAVILTPDANIRFIAGQTIDFSGFATDPETGEIADAGLTWEVLYVTEGVERPFYSATSGIRSGSFTIPTITPFLRTSVAYRIVLTATDPDGLQSQTSIDLLPETAEIRLSSNLPAELFLSGEPYTGTTQGVAGLQREVSAAPSVIVNGRRFDFLRWSDGGPRVRTINTPIGGTDLQAIYRQSEPLIVGVGAGGAPVVRIQQVDTGEVRQISAFDPAFTGGVRVATGDITGDGIPDVIVATGPSGAPIVRIFDGVTDQEVRSFLAFEESFRGGLFIAVADVNRDGVDDIIISPDEGGGPRVRILAGGDPAQEIGNFFGIDDPNFRGGARVALGDVNGDGVPDLLVGAGFGGGPRVAIFDGNTLSSAAPQKFFGDFFAFEDSLRNGVFPALGDINGDGRADVVAGAGPGGGPRVLAFNGTDLLNSGGAVQTALTNFFAGNADNRSGVRIAAKDVDGDDKLDLITADATGTLVLTYLGKDLMSGITNPSLTTDAFPGLGLGVFVG